MSEPKAENIVNVLMEITPESLREFRAWYPTAHATAARIDPADPNRAALVLTVWSTGVLWWVNVRLAEEAYAAWRGGIAPEAYVESARGYKGAARKVVRILWHGETAETVLTKDAIKHRAFYAAIVDPSDTSAIVIDRHALDVAMATYHTDPKWDPKAETARPAITKALFAATVVEYEKAARIYSERTGDAISPVEVQAATWVQWRETHGKAAKAANRKAKATK